MDHAKVRRGVSHSGCNTNGSPVSGEPNTNIRKLITETIPPLLYPACHLVKRFVRPMAQLQSFRPNERSLILLFISTYSSRNTLYKKKYNKIN